MTEIKESPRTRSIPLSIVHALASLRLTVVLIAMAVFLVFAGTLAQIDEGVWTVVDKYFRSFYVSVPLQIFFPRSLSIRGNIPYPGGWLIGAVLLVNLLAAHAVRFKVNWSRSGILMLHAGLIVLLISEVVTGRWAIEGRMEIVEGATCNFVEHWRKSEFAVIDPSDASTDQVTVIPASMLLRYKGETLRDAALPFDVKVERYMVNSTLRPADGASNPATVGEGLKKLAQELPEVSGTATKQMIDAPSAYLTLVHKTTGKALGTYLVSFHLDDFQTVQVDGRTYKLTLRPARTYKPYSLHLIEFRADKYVGTNIPKNYSSLVRLTDLQRNVDREILIYMNHPLRYAGDTFFQADFLRDRKGTILQVVRNPGWLLPYISCVMVALGLLVQFCLSLTRFIRRVAGAAA
jgi:hypothetical protein